MKKVIWLGNEERIIPNYGRTAKGIVKDLPDSMADSFINQGLAKSVKSKAKKESN